MFEHKIEENKDNSNLDLMAKNCLEDARKFHEQYLLKGSRIDLDNAVDSYIDAIKYNPSIPEAYYRLATLLWDKGEINLSSAIEQCKSAINIAPKNSNAHIYAGFFLEMAKNYDEAEQQFKAAIKLNPLNSGRSRLSLASMYLDKMADSNINFKDFYNALYYTLSGSLSLPLDSSSVKMICKNISKNISLMFFDAIGNIMERTKNYAMALKTYDKATTIGREEIYYQKILTSR